MIEIGGAVHSRGSVIQVKVLGVLAMIDDGETDWKVFCIDVNDPDSDKLNDIEGKKKIQFTLGFGTICGFCGQSEISDRKGRDGPPSATIYLALATSNLTSCIVNSKLYRSFNPLGLF